MAGSTYLQVPSDLDHKDFFERIVRLIDELYGQRGKIKSTTALKDLTVTVNKLIKELNDLKHKTIFESPVSYSDDFVLEDFDLVYWAKLKSEINNTEQWALNSFTYNPAQTDPGDLTQIVSDPPTQAEVQAIQDKVNQILSILRNSNIIA